MTTLDDHARLIAALEHLKHPFDRKQIGKLPATGKRPALDFVGHANVVTRLNTYAPDWSYTVDETFTQGGEFWIRGTMTICGVSRVEYGSGPNPLQAISHFIRRAAMRYGVATELWSREELEASPGPNAASKQQRSGTPSTATGGSTSGSESYGEGGAFLAEQGEPHRLHGEDGEHCHDR